MSKLISELLELPDQIRKGDFVFKLSDAVKKPDETVANYVVTPQMVECFNEALNVIKAAVDDNNSKAAYLHGSFPAC